LCKKPRRHHLSSFLLAKSKAFKLSDELKFNKRLSDDQSQEERKMNTIIDGMCGKLHQDEMTTM
jgi:hypothetical protein